MQMPTLITSKRFTTFHIITYLGLIGMFFMYVRLLSTYDLLQNSGSFLLTYALLGVFYFIFAFGVYKTKLIDLKVVVGVFIIAVLILLIIPTNMSLDMYRYYWDGWLIKSGFNPYLILPNDPQLELFRNSELFKRMEPSFNDVYTVYPPLAQFIFTIAHSAYEMLGFFGAKLVMGIPTIILAVYFYRVLDKWLFAIFLLNPLLLFESFNGAHIDAWGILFLTMAVHYVLKNRYSVSSFFLAAAVLTKVIPIILFPFFLLHILRARKVRQGILFSALFFGTIILFYLPFITQSLFPIYRYLSWVQDNEFNAGVYRYLHADILPFFTERPKELARTLSGIGFIASIVYLLRHRFSLVLLLCVFIAFLIFSPAVYPWYTLYLIPLVFLQVQKSKDYKLLWILIVMQFLINLVYFEWVRGQSELGRVLMRSLINLEYITLAVAIIGYSNFDKLVRLYKHFYRR